VTGLLCSFGATRPMRKTLNMFSPLDVGLRLGPFRVMTAHGITMTKSVIPAYGRVTVAPSPVADTDQVSLEVLGV
jgi:hypothetical protein